MRSVASSLSSSSQAASRVFLEDVAEALCRGVSRRLPPLAECMIFGYLRHRCSERQQGALAGFC